MSTMNQRSMMWRTTYAFGAFGFGLLLAYIGYLLANDAQSGMVLRVLAGTLFTLAAFASASAGLGELRGDPSPERHR